MRRESTTLNLKPRIIALGYTLSEVCDIMRDKTGYKLWLADLSHIIHGKVRYERDRKVLDALLRWVNEQEQTNDIN